MARKILIVDDNAINREMLKNTLKADYDILEASNGVEAMKLLHKHYKMLSAVLMDIVMPEMDGYEALTQIRSNTALSQIPVIMVTGSEDEESRVKALSLGANDFILKPFNPEIVRHCLKNNIALRETASILNAIQKDKLTGVYNREAFFEKVSAMTADREPGYYLLSSFDIDNFKLINDQYGAAEGDRILREVGRVVREDMEAVGGVAGRISADNFAVLMPVGKKEMSITRVLQQDRMAFSDKLAIAFSVGRYVITDLSLPASALYDRAYIAKQSVKGRYDTHIAYFDDTMLDKLVRDQQISSDMDVAISEHQFEVWFQPQHNHSTGALIGAEALVRWRHPQKGLISPGEFIPVFEQNGFIYELDKYVWEETCRYLAKWIGEGRNPLPVSVNLSRYDVFRSDMIDVLTGLLEKYNIPVELLRLEITESAFTRSTHELVKIVQQLVDKGFIVEIDDFGSGYSSLNTLKSVPAQVLKLDMRFLESDDGSGRGGNILESIVRMAKWLGMSVIAEGVENQAQADFLASIGCSYIQGYLYAHPMPAGDYEAYCENIGHEERLLTMETVANLDNNSFWDPKSMDTLIFNSYVGAACIFEYHNRKIELLRVNAKYTAILGSETMTVEDVLKLDWISCLTPESLALVRGVLYKSSQTGEEYTEEYEFDNIPGAAPKTYLRSTMRVIAVAGARWLVYCSSENVTAQRQAEENERLAERKNAAVASQLQAVVDNVSCGITAITYENNDVNYLMLNGRYSEILGYTLEEYKTLKSFSPILEEDRAWVVEASKQAYATGKPTTVEFRANKKDGALIWLRCTMTRMFAAEIDKPVQLSIITDITLEKQAEDKALAVQRMLPVALRAVMDSSSEISFVKDKNLRYISCSREFLQLEGVKGEESVIGHSTAEVFPQELAEKYDADDKLVLQSGKSLVDFYPVFPTKDGDKQLQFSKYPLLDAEGNVLGIYGTGRDITEANKNQSRLELLTNSIPGGIAVYEGVPEAMDKIKLTYFSDGFCRLFGYTRAEYGKLAEKNPLSLIAPEDVSRMYARVLALVKDGVPLDFIYRARINGGDYKWINVRAVMGEPHGDKLTVNAMFFDATQQKNALEKLRVSEEVNRLAMQHGDNVVCRYIVATKQLLMSQNVSPIFGISHIEENVPYEQVSSGKVSEDTADAYIGFFESIQNGQESGKMLFQRQSTQGWRWIEAHFSTIFSDSGKPDTAVVTFIDVSKNVEKDLAYKMWQQSMSSKPDESYSLFRCNVSKITTSDTREGSLLNVDLGHGRFDFNAQADKYAEQLVLQEDRGAFCAFLKTDALLASYYQGKRTVSLEYREKLPNESFRWLKVTVNLVEHLQSSGVEAYILFENIDEAKRVELDIIARAETDPLTGVLNRTTFVKKVDELIQASRPGAQHALLMLDIDGFKLVNDEFGHGAGDQLLIDIAGLLRKGMRKDDLVCRLGGDEFLVFLTEVPGKAIVAKKAQQICKLSRKTLSRKVQISGSVGIALYPNDGNTFDMLYKKADDTLYRVKDMGKDTFAFYSTEAEADMTGLEDEEALAITTRNGHTLGKRKRRMLILDDNKMDYELLANLFKDEYLIEKAMDGGSALVKLHHYGSAISVVLLDLMMPGMDGFEVLERMQKSAEMRSIPVIVVSGADDQQTSLQAIRAGAADFVTKPVDPDILRIRVHSAISKAENERLRAKNSYLELQSSEVNSYKTIFERTGMLAVVYDWVKGTFSYSHALPAHLSGQFDGRSLWRILLSDMVTDPKTVQQMQQLVHDVANDRERTDDSMTVMLKVPSGAKHRFDMDVYKQANEFGLTDKLIITFKDIDAKKTPQENT